MKGYGVLFPFIPIHMKSLGMSLEEIGAVYATSSVCAILAPFFAGIVADKLGNFKVKSSNSLLLNWIHFLDLYKILTHTDFTVNCIRSHWFDGFTIHVDSCR